MSWKAFIIVIIIIIIIIIFIIFITLHKLSVITCLMV